MKSALLTILLLSLAPAAIGPPTARADAGEWISLPELNLDDGGDGSPDRLASLVPFEGRLYLAKQLYLTDRLKFLAPATESSDALPGTVLRSYDPDGDDIRTEFKSDAPGLGRIRVLGHTLVAPEWCPRQGTAAGYWAKVPGAEWVRHPISTNVLGVADMLQHKGITFAAGRDEKGAAVWVRGDGDKQWERNALTSEAARWSEEVCRFLDTGDDLFLLGTRQVEEHTLKLAPQAWGNFYVLRYYPDRGERNFFFDGPARPTRALRLLGGGVPFNGKGAIITGGVRFGDTFLYAIASETGVTGKPGYGLFRARVEDALPWCGAAIVGEPVPGLTHARDVTVDNGVCTVLVSTSIMGATKVLQSRDLENWTTLLDATLPAQASCVGVLNDVVYVGLQDGRFGRVAP